MKEIEAKILDIDKSAIEKKLLALGAQKIFDGKIDFRYFDFPGGALRKKGIILRLRKKGDYGELTVKSNFVRTRGAKTSTEDEIKVDFDSARKILLALGYCETSKTIKHRVEYELGAVKFEIDKLPGIPWFLEIEAPSSIKINDMAEAVGYAPEEIKPWWGEDVKKYYQKKNRSIVGKRRALQKSRGLKECYS